MALNALEGLRLPVYGDGSNVRDWIHVDDHAEALCLALERGRPGETYCLGARQERSNLQVAEAICDSLDRLRPDPRGSRRRLITFVEDRPGHDFRYAMDPSRAERALGWKGRRSFEAGLEETLAWYLENESWWRGVRQRTYSGERLGLASASAAG
jgi:dTDP-glucose 4,6-dehydratase